MVKVVRQLSKWKKIEFDPKAFSEGGENLIAIEELNDYTLEICGKTVKNIKSKKRKRPNKKKKDVICDTSLCGTSKSVKKNNFEVSVNEELTDEIEKSKYLPWTNIFVPEEIIKALSEKEFENPTEIQHMSIPAAIKGRRDILGAAETGSGKTLAFGIPIIYGIMKNLEKIRLEGKKDGASPKLWALILTPTRELAVQIKDHLEVATKYTEIKVAVVVGGLSQEKQTRLLRREPHIVVATPGRLWELIQLGEPLFSDIHSIRFLAIDETDRMLEKNHFPELRALLERVNFDNEMKKGRQNFVFSATLTLVHQPPSYIKKKRWKKSLDKITLTPGQKLNSIIKLLGITDPKIVDLTKKSGTAESLTETRILCGHEEKDFYLYYFLLAHPGRTLIFCNSISCVKRLSSLLHLLNMKPLPLHSNMIQKQRLKNLERFSSGNGVLLATDVAGRGLDIPLTEHVVHYQVPHTSEAYIHRSGRTARALRPGLTMVLVSPEEASVYTRTLSTLNRDSELADFPVTEELLKVAKDRVLAARQVDLMLLRKRKDSDKKSWLEKAAEEADLIIDESLRIEAADSREEAQKKKMLKVAKSRLQFLLSKEVLLQPQSAVEKVTSIKTKPKLKLYRNKQN